MVRTKKTSPSRKSANLEKAFVSEMLCMHKTSLGKCWLCWLFKSLIVLFCAFLLIWIGFCCGILKSHAFKYRGNTNLNNLMSKDKFCSPGKMSQEMSTNSKDELMGDPMLAILQTKTGADFDREFLIQMIIHHEGGVEMAKMALEKSTNEDIRKLAQNIIDSQSAEVEQMKSWVK